ncbi:ABC transporter ATP-binding protein [Glycomyces buryatensis]|uniref:ABC transporter ATP-binding protein n=1 Tax=Glycomyces buryatensis TaxID=2570927 RepID=A0A4S8QDV4_9ACTN|nr:ABC transporter ATP-binding protein [Glycomyces buryatensis]THV38694.1 ABC transporter ATP-binding protein [Glycomyces buryatensis]
MRKKRHLLKVDGLQLRFGGLQVLDDLSLTVDEGQIVGLIGPNGAGKTSCFNCLTGIYQPQDGRVLFDGTDVSRLPTHRRARLGMGRTWQNLGVIDSLTVTENVMLAQHQRTGYSALAGMLGLAGTWLRERELRRDAAEIIDYFGLEDIADERCGSLPYGKRKTCDMAMALATDPKMLLLDEPASGLSPEEALGLVETLRELRDRLKLTILMIEHHVPLVAEVCDYVYVLNFGKLLTEGEPDEIQRHPEVIAAYLGGAAAEPEVNETDEADDTTQVLRASQSPGEPPEWPLQPAAEGGAHGAA